MSVKLRQQKNKKGISLYLDICHGGIRERQYLKELTLIINPKTTEDRIKNTQTRITAESLRLRKETELAHELNGMDAPVKSDSLILPYIEQFRDDYSRKDKQKVVAMAFHFSKFQASKEFKFKNLNENIVSDFKKYLEGKVSGATTKSYFNKFRQVIRRAYIDKLCRYDIKTFEAKFKLDSNNLKKETLTTEEIQKVANTPCENKAVKMAFIFCCFTGLDFVDAYWLKWEHIAGSELRKPREKTIVGRTIPLHRTAMDILSLMDKGTEYVFQGLPHRGQTISVHGRKIDERQYSWSACDRTLQALIKRAGISKHITFHCARHSFGTNTEGDDGTIAQLLGHSNTQMVKVYRRAKQERLKKAVDSLEGVKVT